MYNEEAKRINGGTIRDRGWMNFQRRENHDENMAILSHVLLNISFVLVGAWEGKTGILGRRLAW